MKKIGEIKGVPVVEGDPNLIKNEILYVNGGGDNNDKISLLKRDNTILKNITGGDSSGGFQPKDFTAYKLNSIVYIHVSNSHTITNFAWAYDAYIGEYYVVIDNKVYSEIEFTEWALSKISDANESYIIDLDVPVYIGFDRSSLSNMLTHYKKKETIEYVMNECLTYSKTEDFYNKVLKSLEEIPNEEFYNIYNKAD